MPISHRGPRLWDRLRSAISGRVETSGDGAADQAVPVPAHTQIDQPGNDDIDAVVLRYVWQLTPRAFAHYTRTPQVVTSMERSAGTGDMRQATLNEKLDFALNKAEVQTKLRECGQPVSGSKGALLERVIQADPTWSELTAQDVHLFFLTEQRTRKAEEFSKQSSEARKVVVEQCRALVRQKRYDEASAVGKRFTLWHGLKDKVMPMCGPCPACAKYDGKRVAVEYLPPEQAPGCTGYPKSWGLKAELPSQTQRLEG